MTAEPSVGRREMKVVPLARTTDNRGRRTPIEVTTGPDAIRVLTDELGNGLVPDVYVSDGRLVYVEGISGTSVGQGIDESSPLPMSAVEVSPPRLAGLLAEHAHVFEVRHPPRGESYEIEVTPPSSVLAAILSRRTWADLKPLLGVVGAPILRRDGSLLQDSGYDAATGLYLASRVKVDRVPETPTPAQVTASRAFLLERFLRDFPWVDDADRANYVALLVTPVIRPHLRCLSPFGMITATTPASGKTILSAGIGLVYGQRVLPWTDSDEELRKAITSVLADQAGVVVFDNLPEGSVIDSPTLALLITVPTWSDRLLGRNKTAVIQNDRLWLATGNNLATGGDMASRTVPVRLDPDMPRPETRTGFVLPHLDSWIAEPGNQAQLLWHVLVLVADWVNHGAPRDTTHTMRQFTAWAQALGGFLAHHGVDGFLANLNEMKAHDDDELRWAAFYRKWLTLNPGDLGSGPARLTAAAIRQSAEIPFPGAPDPWDGTFPTTRTGRLPGVSGLGRMLNGVAGRWRGNYVLRSHVIDDRSVYWVERGDDES